MESRKILFISDIHSNARALLNVVRHIESTYSKDDQIIFLGDVFDWRDHLNPNGGNSVAVYDMLRYILKAYPNSEVIDSNHQNKLMRYLRGNNVYIDEGLSNTIRDFNQSGKANWEQEIYYWLTNRPLYLLRENYLIAHAFADTRLIGNDKPSRRLRDKAIYGLRTQDNSRICWWENPRNEDFIRVAGHYHQVFISDKCLVIDGGSGRDGGHIVTYDTDTQEIAQW